MAHQLRLGDNVQFKGYQANPYAYIAKAKALVMSSRWEGLPTVLVEAAYLNTPMIAFDCNYGPGELSQGGQFGKLLDQGDVQGLAEALLSVQRGEMLDVPNVNEFEEQYAAIQYWEAMQGVCQQKAD